LRLLLANKVVNIKYQGIDCGPQAEAEAEAEAEAAADAELVKSN